MHEAVATLATAEITLTNPSKAPTSLSGWSNYLNDNNTNRTNNFETWSSVGSYYPQTNPIQTRLSQTKTFDMTSRLDNAIDRSANARWQLNSNGQLVDAKATAPQWERDLADEIVRLQINSKDTSGAENRLHTPPKSMSHMSVVNQLNEASPFDTASSPSVGSSPSAPDAQISNAHSRESSIDTSASRESVLSVAGKTLLAGKAQAEMTLSPAIEHKERPHSFSGGLSTAELRRLQQAGEVSVDSSDLQSQPAWLNAQQSSEQPSYPSLTNGASGARPYAPAQAQRYQVRTDQGNGPQRDELQVDYNVQQRNFNPLPQSQGTVNPASAQQQQPPFNGRQNNVAPATYRQPPRSFPQQGVVTSPTQMAYTAHQLGLSNSQDLYNMMMPGNAGHEHPALTRVQQQHNVYTPRSHQPANSDPAAMREAAALALLTNNVPGFAPGMFQPNMGGPGPMQMYPNQYFAAQEAYGRPDVLQMARLQSQFTGQFPLVPGQGLADGSMPTSPGSVGSSGPSANNRKLGLYKTELCRSWEEKGTCRYGAKCQFAHGEDELRNVSRHPKYKTEICRTFWVSGSCPYGKRCCFIHTEVPQNGNPNGSLTDGSQQARSGNRERSSSTNSDPNDGSNSLIARIKRNKEQSANGLSTPVHAKSPGELQRPALTLNTSFEGGAMKQQNKSAYPTFASNPMAARDNITIKSPAPVTAGPDLGRHNNFGYGPTRHKTTASGSSIRNSFTSDDIDGSYSPTPPASSYTVATPDGTNGNAQGQRVNGHVRSGSAGNWGSIGRASTLGASSFPSAGGDIMPGNGSPWSTSELAVGSSRLHDKTWGAK